MADNDSTKYLPELMAEKDSIDPSFVHAIRLIKQEIDNINDPKPEPTPNKPKKDLLDVSGKPQKVECDILVPAERHPNVNFVGRLIGPGGSTMKGIQEHTNTRMAVLGKGSVREKDRKKAEELKDTDEKYAHLNYPLHVHISALGPVPQAFVNLGRAAAEIQKLIVVDESDHQGYGAAMQGMRGGGRGGMGNQGMRGRGGQNRGFQRGVRGGMQRGGSGSSRGSGQGGRGSSRGGNRGRGGRGGQSAQFSAMAQAADSFGDDFGFDSYGSAAAGFETGYEGYDDSYDASYDTSFGDGGFGDASFSENYTSFGQDSFDTFGNGAGTKGSGGYGQGSFRGKMRGGGRGRQKPY